jgi:hypothetical protein
MSFRTRYEEKSFTWDMLLVKDFRCAQEIASPGIGASLVWQIAYKADL